MEDRELLNIIETEESNALGYIGGDLTKERADNMDYYLGEPLGNEVEGRSQVVTSDVADTIESIMPDLINIFVSTDEVVRFAPKNQEDEKGAEQESDYINHVFYKQNNGFLILYSWFKDALLQKTGYVKKWWDESEDIRDEEYERLTDEELTQLLSDPEVEAKEHTAYPMEFDTLGEIQVNDVKITRTRKIGQEKIANLPPEEVLVSSDATSISLQECRFVAHKSDKTYSELLEMGFKKEILDKVPSGSNLLETEEEIARKHLSDEQEETSADESMRKITVTEAYLRVDTDDDGKAELWQVFKAGHEILDKEKVDTIPIYALTPMILPHKHHGLCPADVIKEIQLTKTTLYRGMLDNMFLQNNGRFFVQGDVNINDLLVTRPLGIVRGKVGSSVTRLDTPQLPIQSFQMLEYMDKLRRERSGAGNDMQSLDPNVLANANTGVMNQAFNHARAKIELIARVFAETGVKDLFLGIHQDLIKHQDKDTVIKLRNEWVPINPSEWKNRTDMTIKVGLGTGNVDQQLAHLAGIANLQERIGTQLPQLLSEKNVYNMADATIKKAGFKINEFFTDPESDEGKKLAQELQQSQGPDLQEQAVKGTLEVEMAKIEQRVKEMQEESQKNQAQYVLDAKKAEAAHEEKMTELELKFVDRIQKATQTQLPHSAI